MSDSPPPSPRRTQRPGTVIVALVLVIALAVTGIGVAGLAAWSLFSDDDSTQTTKLADPPEPSTAATEPAYPAELAQFYEQDLDWRRCGEGQDQCTRLKVPLDYAEPDKQTIDVAVLRVPATKRDQRVGQLVVNPGGPGGSGVSYAAAGSRAFGETLARYFDIVGFDPRGVANSTPLKCAGTAKTDEFIAADQDPDTPAEATRLDRLTREFGESCLAGSGDLARHMSTVEAAKDMDILRAALGEQKLDYFGASYGTFLGATYADLFPTHVRRMVLDGATDPAQDTKEANLSQARGFQTALRSYLRDCVAQGDCIVGDTVEEGERRIKALLEQIDAKPLPTSGGRELTQALATYGIIYPLYVEQYWPLLTESLRQALDGKGDALLQLADEYASRGPDGYKNNAMASLIAVNCLDRDEGIPIDQVPDEFADFQKASPTFARLFAYGLSTCKSWPIHTGNKTMALDAKGAPPILVVGTTRDPATPYAQAVSLAKQLETGVLLTRDGDGHTGFRQGNACVDKAIEAYLVGGKVPEDGRSC